ncbi:MAG: hypothetical protein H0U70_06700 [Tatlockia sp.]|nr:hypothetical protein [Tatlockia sp.]
MFFKRNFIERSLGLDKLNWLFFIPISLLVFAIWLPFGFSLTGLIEEWGILGAFVNSGLLFFINSNSSFAAFLLRPLTIFPHALAYFLDPNSFFYWHLLSIFALIIKGGAITSLIWQATRSKSWSIIAGLLIVVYPADTMQLTLRVLHINCALSCLLLASTLFVSAFYSIKPIRAYTLALISAILLGASLAMYEASLALALLPFFIIYSKEGFKSGLIQASRAKSRIALWMLTIFLYLLYVAISAPKVNNYQQVLIADRNLLNIINSNLSKLLSPGMTHSLFGGWIDAVKMVYKEIDYWGYFYLFITISLVFSLIAYLCALIDKNFSSQIQKSGILIRLAAVGIVNLLLGYLPFLIGFSYIMTSQRTYLFASSGAVLFWISLLMLLAKWKKIYAFGLAIFLVTCGLGMQLFQFHHYLEISDKQRMFLKNIVDNFDGKLNKKTLIILDGSNQLTSTWMLLLPNLIGALTYFYEKPINNLEVCYMPGKEWRSANFTRSGSCIEQEKKWVFQAPLALPIGSKTFTPAADKEILKRDAIVLHINSDGSIKSDPALTAHRSGLKQNKRYQEILVSNGWSNYFKSFWTATDKGTYRWSPSKWWSMDLPIRGGGWSDPEWEEHRFNFRSSSWKTQENATLLFDLSPQQSTYTFKGELNFLFNSAVRASIRIYINDHLIPYRWLSIKEFSAELPANILFSGVNRIRFHSIIEPVNGLSFSLSSFELFPSRPFKRNNNELK